MILLAIVLVVAAVSASVGFIFGAFFVSSVFMPSPKNPALADIGPAQRRDAVRTFSS